MPAPWVRLPTTARLLQGRQTGGLPGAMPHGRHSEIPTYPTIFFASSTPNPGPAQAFCIFCQVQGRNAPRLLPSHPSAAEAARGEPCSRLLSARHRGHRTLGRAVVFTPFLKDGQQNHQSMVPIPFCLGTCPLKAAEAAQGSTNCRVCPLATPPRPPTLCWWGPMQPPWSCIHRHPRQRRAGGAGTRKVPR